MEIQDIGQYKLDTQETGEARLKEACEKYGFLNASYAHLDAAKNIVKGFTTYPEEWVRYYMENKLFLSDPIIRYGASTIAPLDWDRFWGNPEFTPLFKAAAEFGVGTRGISIPVISPFGDRGIFSVTAESELADWQALVNSTLSDLRHEASILHLLAVDVIDTAISLPYEPLSSDEMAVLQILATGVTPRIISEQLRYSDRRVSILTESIMTKFKCKTIKQAVGTAVSAGVLRWTDFFANPVAEVGDIDNGILIGGMVVSQTFGSD